jgi:CBS domain-containing protein
MKATVKDVMTTRVVWVTRDASFKEMAAALRENRVSAFPVVDEQNKVIGVVSEADLLTKEALIDEPEGLPAVITGILHRRDQEKARGLTAGDLMTRPPVTVHPGDAVEHAARLRPPGRGDPPRGHRQRDPARVPPGPAPVRGDGPGRRRDAGGEPGHRADGPRHRAPDPARPGRGGRPRPAQLPPGQPFRVTVALTCRWGTRRRDLHDRGGAGAADRRRA